MSAEALPMPSGLVDDVKRRFSLTHALEAPREIPLTIKSATVETKTLQVFGRTIEACNIVPHANISPQGRIFLANGWRSDARSNKEYITALVQAGFTVTSFANDFTKGDAAEIKEANKTLPNMGKHPKLAFIKAAAVNETLQAFPVKPDEKVSIVAHSEGTIYSGLAAALNPDQFDSFIQINTAGHAKKTSIAGIIIKGGLESRNTKRSNVVEQDPEEKVSAADVVKYVLRNSSVALAELRIIAGTSTTRLVERLKTCGLQTGCIAGTSDRLFPHRNLKKHIESGLFDHAAEVVDGTHELSSSPNYAEHTIAMLFAMRRKLPQRGVLFTV